MYHHHLTETRMATGLAQ